MSRESSTFPPEESIRRRSIGIDGLAVFMLSALVVICAGMKWLPLSLTDAFSFATSAICVWLVTRENLWNWPVGLASNLFLAVLFWETRLFADVGLQGVYFALGIWGWWRWLHGGRESAPLPVSRTSGDEWLAIAVFLGFGTWGLRELLIVVNGAAPFWDAMTTTFSLAAQYLLCQKRIENWWLWMVADLIAVPLFASKGLPLPALLYAGFFALCVIGLRRWQRELAAS